MVKNIFMFAAALSMVVAFGFSHQVTAEETGPETIILKTAKAKKPVLFPHRSHQARLKCDTCHKNDNFAKSANDWTKKQGHALCKSCHKKNKAEGAPTKCSACHKKGLK